MAGTGDNIGVGIQVTLTDSASSQLKIIQKAVETLNTSINKINTTKIDSMTKSFTALSKVMGSTQIKNLERTQIALTSFSKVPSSAATTISKLAESVSKLKTTPAQAKNITALSTSFKKVGSSVDSLKNVKNIDTLATSINKLNASTITANATALNKLSTSFKNFGKSTDGLKPATLTTTGTSLKDMSTALKTIKPATLSSFAESLGTLKKNSTSAFATSFKTLAGSFKTFSANTKDLNFKTLSSLGKSMEQVKLAASGKFASSLNAIATSFKNLNTSISTVLSDKIRNVGTALKKLETPNLAGTTTQVKNLSASITKAGTESTKVTTKTDKAAKSIQKVGTESEIAAKSVSQLARQSALTSFAGIVDSMVILGAIFKSFQPAVEFEKSMSKVRAIANASESDMKQLTAQVLDMGRTTIFSAAEAAEGMAVLTQAGFNTTDALEALPTVLSLAAAGGIEVGEAASIATATMHGFGMEAKDLSGLMDTLAVAAMNSNTNISELGKAMKTAAPIARASGAGIEELTTILGAMANAGIKGSNAGQNYKRMVLRLIEPTAKAGKALDELGVSTTTASGDLRSMTDIMRELNDAGMSLQQSKNIFGLWSAAAALAVSQNADSLSELKSIIGAADGALQTMARTMTDNVAGSMKKLKDSTVQVAINGLLPFMKTLNSIVLTLQSFAKKIAIALENISPFMSQMLAGVGIFTAVMVAMNLFNIVLLRVIGGVIRFKESNEALRVALAGSKVELGKNAVALKARVGAMLRYVAVGKQAVATEKLDTAAILENTFATNANTAAKNAGAAAGARSATAGAASAAAGANMGKVLGVLKAAAMIAVRGIGLLVRGLVGLLGPVGIAVTAVTGLVWWLNRTKKPADDTAEALKRAGLAASDSATRIKSLVNAVAVLDSESSKGDTLKAFNDIFLELDKLSAEGPEDLKIFALKAANSIDTVNGAFFDGGRAMAEYQRELDAIQIKAAQAALNELKESLGEVEVAQAKAFKEGDMEEYGKQQELYVANLRKIEQGEETLNNKRVIAVKNHMKILAKMNELPLDMAKEQAAEYLKIKAEEYGEEYEIVVEAYNQLSKVAREKAEEEGLNIVELANLRKEKLVKGLQEEIDKYKELGKEIDSLKAKQAFDKSLGNDDNVAVSEQRINEIMATRVGIAQKIVGAEKQIKNAVLEVLTSQQTLSETEQRYAELMGQTRAASIKGLEATYNELLAEIQKVYNDEVALAQGNSEKLLALQFDKNRMILNAKKQLNDGLSALDDEYKSELQTDTQNEIDQITKDNDKRKEVIRDRFDYEIEANAGNNARIIALNDLKNNALKKSDKIASREMFVIGAEKREKELESVISNIEAQKIALKNQLNSGVISKGEYATKIAKLEEQTTKLTLDLRTDILNGSGELWDKESQEYKDYTKEKVDAEIAATEAIFAARQAMYDQEKQQRSDRLSSLQADNAAQVSIVKTKLADQVIDQKQANKELDRLYIDDLENKVDSTRRDRIATAESLNSTVLDVKQAKATELQAQEQLASGKASIREKEEAEEDAQRERARFKGATFAAWIMSQYQAVSNAMLDISVKAVNMLAAQSDAFAAIVKGMNIAGTAVEELDKKIADATANAELYAQAITRGGIFIFQNMDLKKGWEGVTKALKEQKDLLVVTNKLANTQVDETTDLESLLSKVVTIRENYNYLGDEELAQLRDAKKAILDKISVQREANYAQERALQDQLSLQEKINEEESGTGGIENMQDMIAQAKEYGIEIENYAFDQDNADRLKTLESESNELDAQIAAMKYQQYLDEKAAVARGASEEALAKLREDNEKQLKILEDQNTENDLEYDAIDSKLNLKMVALKLENDLKIAQYEEELVREQELHQMRLDQIEAERLAKLAVIEAQKELEEANAAKLEARYEAMYSSTPATQGFARGGRIPGEGTQDTVNVKARPGEWFIRNESAGFWQRKFGSGFMNAINNPLSTAGRGITSQLAGSISRISAPTAPMMPSTGGIQTFATGGQVLGESSASPTTKIVLQSPSGASVTTNVEGSVKDFLNILQEAGMRA